MKTSQLSRLFKKINNDLTARIQLYVLQFIQAKILLDELSVSVQMRSQLPSFELSEEQRAIYFISTRKLTDNLKAVGELLEVLKKDEVAIMDTVMTFNNLALAQGKDYHEYMIRFDKQTAEIFSGQRERLGMIEVPRVKRKYTRRQPLQTANVSA